MANERHAQHHVPGAYIGHEPDAPPEGHREASNALRDAPAEIERLRSDAADLHHTKFDLGLSNLPPASIAADWFMKFSERKQALIGEKVVGRKSDAE